MFDARTSPGRRPGIRPRFARSLAAIAAATLALSVAACSAGDGGSANDEASTTFTIGQRQPLSSLDPVTGNPPTYSFPAYEPLIYQQPDGELIPALATEWGYTDETNTSFEVTLRDGVKFSDGDTLDATAVKGSLDYFLSLEENPNRVYAGPVESVEIVDDLTIRLTYSEPFPVAAQSLSQDWRFGMVVSPTGLADPSALAQETHGAGQYVLDPSKTIDGSEYTFTANSNYWNQEAVKFDSVVLKVISDPAAQLAALENGEIDYANNPTTLTVESALEKGFQNAPNSGGVWVLMLVNRANEPIQDERVREAIGLALDRASISSAVFNGQAAQLSSIAPTGQLGDYSPVPIEQNIEQAKALLEEAGYGDGVTVKLLDTDGIDANFAVGTAVQAQLAEAGITIELIQATGSFDEFIGPLFGMEADAAVWQFSNINTYYQFLTNLLPAGTLANPGGETDAELDALFAEAGSAVGDDELDTAMRAVAERYDSLFWTIPISASEGGQLFAKNVGNVPQGASIVQSLNGFSPDPSTSWEFTN